MFQVHKVEVLDGSNLAWTDRLKVGFLSGVAIAATIGGLTGAVVENPGTGYTSIPTLTAAGGTLATFAPSMQADALTLAVTGTGYAPGDTITATGGTASQQAIAEVLTTKLVSASVNAAGTGYAPGDTIVPAGGTFTGAPLITVTHTKAVSATVAAGGTGGTNGTQTVTGTTGTGTKFQASVTVAGNAITAVLSITVAGDYTVNPTAIAAEPVTGASLAGAQLNVVLGALTVTATGGVYTANSAALTQTSTSGAGTGATFNTAAYGVNTLGLNEGGSYTVLAANPLSQGSTSGSGTGATINLTSYGIRTVAVSVPGIGYVDGCNIAVTGGAGAGAIVKGITHPQGEKVIVPITTIKDLPDNYSVFVTADGPCHKSVVNKSNSGFNIELTPLATGAPVLATMLDILIVG